MDDVIEVVVLGSGRVEMANTAIGASVVPKVGDLFDGSTKNFVTGAHRIQRLLESVMA